MRVFKQIISITILLVVTGCNLPFVSNSDKYYNLTPMDPLPQYAELWVGVVECLEDEKIRSRTFDQIIWMSATRIDHSSGIRAGGTYHFEKMRIVIATSHLEVEPTVRHELVHHAAPHLEHEDPVFTMCETATYNVSW